MTDVVVIVSLDVNVQIGLQEGFLDFALHLERQVILVGNLIHSIHCDGEKAFFGTEIKDGILEDGILGGGILIVHVFGNFGNGVAQQVLDDGGGVRFTGTVGARNPEGLVNVCVVVEHRSDYLSENAIKLLIGDEYAPLTILFCLDVVGGLLTSQLNDVRILGCHIIVFFFYYLVIRESHCFIE